MDMKRYSTTDLRKSERHISLQELDENVKEEVEEIGFPRNARLAEQLPGMQTVKLQVTEHGVKILERFLRKDNRGLYALTNSDGKMVIYTERKDSFGIVYPDYEVTYIEHPEVGVEYALPEDFMKQHEPGEEMFFGNDVDAPDRLRLYEGSVINVLVMKNGNIRIDAYNLNCNMLVFQVSRHFENTIDILVDASVQPGEMAFRMAGQKSIQVHHPILAELLKHQSFVKTLDVERGLFYGESNSGYVAGIKGNNTMVNLHRVNNISNITANRYR